MNSNLTESLNKKFVIVPTALGRFQRPTILALVFRGKDHNKPMTSQQKIIILLWLLTLASLIALTIFDEWIMNNWGGIKWPFLCVVLFFSAFSQTNSSSSVEQGRHNINEIVSSNPWIKVYMAAYCFIVVIMSLRAMNSGINSFEHMGNAELIMSIFGIMLPVFVIQQIQLYKNAGK